jgi:hypothetical protein
MRPKPQNEQTALVPPLTACLTPAEPPTRPRERHSWSGRRSCRAREPAVADFACCHFACGDHGEYYVRRFTCVPTRGPFLWPTLTPLVCRPVRTAPVTTLLNTCRTACEEVTPFVEAVYAQLAKDPNAAVRKEDKSFFSLADGVVQVSSRVHRPHRAARDAPRGTMTFYFDERC